MKIWVKAYRRIAKMTSILSCEWIFSETWRNATYVSFPEMGSELGWGMSSDCEDDSRQISLLSHQVEEQRTKSRWNSSVLQGKFWSWELGVRLIKEYFEVGRTSEAVSLPSSSSPSCFSSLSPSFPTSSPQCSGGYFQSLSHAGAVLLVRATSKCLNFGCVAKSSWQDL